MAIHKVYSLTVIITLVCAGRSENGQNGCSPEQHDRIHQLERELSALQATLSEAREKIDQQKTWKREALQLLKKNVNEIEGEGELSRPAKDVSRRQLSTDECINLEHLRLVNGSNNYEGRLEVKSGDTWMNVCEDSWSQPSAQLICSMLGHPGSVAGAVGGGIFGNGRLPVLNGGCTYSAGVICDNFDNYQIRLVNGSNQHEGRVEIMMNGQWGTVCQDNFDMLDAKVVCSSLGFGSSGVPVAGAQFGQGTGPVWMRSLNCQGTESHLLQCTSSYPAGYRSQCSHSGDVSVICGDLHNYPVRLIGGANEHEGRVELKFHGQWTSIYSSNWDTNDANVVCQMLGYSGINAVAVTSSSAFGQGSGPQLLGYLNCAGTERHILLCPSSYVLGGNNWNYHSSDAGVRCQVA